jgi:periplasmic protein TorT
MKHAARWALVAATLAAVIGSARAADPWWPVKVYDLDSGSPKVTDYVPVEKAAKPWNICVLFPHMKDTFWVAVDYGVVEEVAWRPAEPFRRSKSQIAARLAR